MIYCDWLGCLNEDLGVQNVFDLNRISPFSVAAFISGSLQTKGTAGVVTPGWTPAHVSFA